MAQVAAAEAASFPLNSTSHSQAAGGDVLRSPGAKLPVNDEKQVLVEAHQDVEKHSAATANPLEVYSVFTVGQKKAIILSGSFIGLLSYMSGTIYYPAIDQVENLPSHGPPCYLLTRLTDQPRSGSFGRKDQSHGNRVSGTAHRRGADYGHDY